MRPGVSWGVLGCPGVIRPTPAHIHLASIYTFFIIGGGHN